MEEIISVKLQQQGYKVTTSQGTLTVPEVPGNRHYQEVQAWIADGGIVEPEFTKAELLDQQAQAINQAIQNHLDTQAQRLRYDNINAIGKYVGYVNDFQAEAEALGAWASSCWKVAGQIEANVQAGNRVMPTIDEVLAELPIYGGNA